MTAFDSKPLITPAEVTVFKGVSLDSVSTSVQQVSQFLRTLSPSQLITALWQSGNEAKP